jgi:integrase
MKNDPIRRDGPKDRRFEKIGDLVSIFQRGGRWYANYQFNDKQQRPSLQTASKKEARRKAIRIEAELLEGRHAKPVKAPRIQQVTAAYIKNLRSENKAQKTLAKCLLVERRVLDLAVRRKARSINDINLAFIDAYRAEAVTRELKPASPKTLLNELVIVRQIVNFALSRRLITTDPLHGLKLKKVKPRPQPCWTRAGVDQILAAAKPPFKVPLTVLAETGMRVGELKNLTWDDVDFERGVLHIRAKDGWRPKTGDQRAIPLEPIRRLLKQLPRRARWVVTAASSNRFPKGDHQISERRLLQYLKRVLKRLGLPGHLHTFRHSFISNALTKGIPEAVVRSWVGHVDRDVMQLYTHIADEASQAAMQRLQQANTNPLQEQEKCHATQDAGSAQFQHNEQGDQNAGSAN